MKPDKMRNANILILLAVAVCLWGRPAHGEAMSCKHCVDYTAGAIVLPADWARDQGLLFAARELAQAMEDLYATAPVIVSDAEFSDRPGEKGLVIVGRGNSLIQTYSLSGMLGDEDIPAEAYHVAAGKLAGVTPVIVAHGGGVRGCIFALTYMAERLRLEPRSVHDITLDREPFFSIRIMGGDSPETALRYGYNTVFTTRSHAQVLTLEDYDPDFFFQHFRQREALLERRAEYDAGLKHTESLNLDAVSRSDEFEFHKALLKRPYASRLTRGDGSDWLCFCNNKLWEIYAAKYDELMKDFPELDYTMIRLGENYAKGDNFGNVVAKKEFWEYCTKCQGVSYNQRIATLINRTWDVVVDKHKGRYIHRTWDTNSDTFHTSPEVYADILKQVKNKKKLYISVKYTKTDFWRYNEHNQTIGVGDVPQIVEYQCKREYEGKGAFPNYIGEQLSDGYLYAMDNGAIGAWNWHHGGGWNGPHLRTDIWNEANIYAAAHLAWNPRIPAETLAREWATLNYGRENAENMAKLLLMSDDAVLKLVYFAPYAKLKGDPWMPNENWVRDDVIKGGDRLRRIYEKAREYVPEMVNEKEEGVRIIKNMLALADNLIIKEQDKELIFNSLMYELYWARVLRSYAAAFLYYCRWQDTGSADDRRIAAMYAQKWEHDWNSYRAEIPKLAWTASLYLDDGMEDTMAEVLEDLTSRR